MAPDELPSGTVTLLFTDIEGSTRLLKQLRDGYGEVLDEHRRLLRAAFEAHGGREIDTQGDAFFVAFARAQGCRRRRDRRPDARWPATRGPTGAQVRVRMGIHTGEPLRRQGGLPRPRAAPRARGSARPATAARSCSSNATRELIEDDLLDGDRAARPRRAAASRTSTAPERIAQVVYPGMPASFPPLKTVEAARGRAVRGPRGRTGGRGRRALRLGATAPAAGAGDRRGGRGGRRRRDRGDRARRRRRHGEARRPTRSGILSADGRTLVASVPVGTSPSGVAVGEGSIWVDERRRADGLAHRPREPSR